MKKSRDVVSEKEKLSLTVMQLAKGCSSLEQLEQKLSTAKLNPYKRNGILTGVWLGKRKFRLTTLGIEKEHLREMTQEQKRLKMLSQSKISERGLER